jgi:hypothetical protein
VPRPDVALCHAFSREALPPARVRRLVHSDLKPQNVLLKSSTRDPRGWMCKVRGALQQH